MSDVDAAIAKARYMAKQYQAGVFARGGEVKEHYLETLANEIEKLYRERHNLQTSIDEYRLERNRHTNDITALESNVDACSSLNASDADRIYALLLQVDNLNDELKWVYDYSNEDHITRRLVMSVPPEER
jgi:chromosome segregation ATPase